MIKKLRFLPLGYLVFLFTTLLHTLNNVAYAATDNANEIPYAWYISRITGIAAFIFFGVIVISGLLLTTDLVESKILKFISKGKIFTIHKFIVLIAIGLMTIHFLVLLFDDYLSPSIWDLIIPFKINNSPLLIGLGIIGYYFLILVTVSSYLVKYIPTKLWKYTHMLSFVAFVLILIHGFFKGSDTNLIGIQLTYYSFGFTVLILILLRIFKVLS